MTKKVSDSWLLLRELLHGKRGRIAKMLIFQVVKSSPVWLVPIITARMIDLATTPSPGRVGYLITYAVIALVLYIQNVPTHILYIKHLSKITRGIGCDLRVRLCRQLQSLSIGYHNKTSIGKLHSKAIRDIEMIENVPRMFTEQMFQFVIISCVTLIVIVWRAPMSLLFFAVAVPICAFMYTYFTSKIRLRVSEYREQVEGMSSSLSDMLKMIPITRAHGLEEQQMQVMQHRIQGVYHVGQTFDRITAIFGSSAWVIMGVMQTLFLTGSIYACFEGHISIGDIVMFNSFFMMLSGQLIGVLNLLPQFSQVRESFESVMEVLNAPDLESNNGKKLYTEVCGGFDFRQVCFQYPGTNNHALSDLCLNVAPGESIALVGPSGSGKTTVLSMVLGFVRPDSGTILLDGKDMMEMDLRSYRRHVGVVTQEPVFFSGSIFENVAYGRPDICARDVLKSLDEANAMEFIRELPGGIDCIVGAGGVKLSGGQLQRLAIARAIIRNPRVLILDEATSALDMESEALVQQALERIMQNRTTFIVAHRISTVRNADRIVILEDGRIVDAGQPEQLLGSDNFYSRAVRPIAISNQ